MFLQLVMYFHQMLPLFLGIWMRIFQEIFLRCFKSSVYVDRKLKRFRTTAKKRHCKQLFHQYHYSNQINRLQKWVLKITFGFGYQLELHSHHSFYPLKVWFLMLWRYIISLLICKMNDPNFAVGVFDFIFLRCHRTGEKPYGPNI